MTRSRCAEDSVLANKWRSLGKSGHTCKHEKRSWNNLPSRHGFVPVDLNRKTATPNILKLLVDRQKSEGYWKSGESKKAGIQIIKGGTVERRWYNKQKQKYTPGEIISVCKLWTLVTSMSTLFYHCIACSQWARPYCRAWSNIQNSNVYHFTDRVLHYWHC